MRQIDDLPAELSVLFGEWLYNMRSALDYIIWAAAVYTSGQFPPLGEAGLQYPIYDDEGAWSRNGWRLKPLAAHHLEMLKMMQPFNSNPDANYLGWINRLARLDRHRRLAVWTTRIAEANPVFEVPSGVAPKLEWGQRTLVGGWADVARLTFPDAESADGLRFNPRMGIDPEIVEWSASPFWGRIRFSERLQMMHVFLYAEINVYDFDCTGSEEAAKTVTESFRAESERRRASGLFPPVTRAQAEPVEWTTAEAPRESTLDKFMGVDFPPDGPGSVS